LTEQPDPGDTEPERQPPAETDEPAAPPRHPL